MSTALIHWNKLDFSIRFLSISERYLYGKQFMIHVWTLLIFEALKPNAIQVHPNMNKKSFAYFSGKCTCRDCFTLNTRGPQQYLGKLWSLNNNPTGSKCAKKYISNSITPPEAWFDKRQHGSLLSCCLWQVLRLPSECFSRNQHSLDQPIWNVASVSCR